VSALSPFHAEPAQDYVLLAHSGHGANSYAIQYYLVYDPLRMFLHLAWGGVYMDETQAVAEIRKCFSIADDIVAASQKMSRLQTGEQLIVVASSFYGSYWQPVGISLEDKEASPESATNKTPPCKQDSSAKPEKTLRAALRWLTSQLATPTPVE
jgi:hypothetical protein